MITTAVALLKVRVVEPSIICPSLLPLIEPEESSNMNLPYIRKTA
jgi:hypothetical protein